MRTKDHSECTVTTGANVLKVSAHWSKILTRSNQVINFITFGLNKIDWDCNKNSAGTFRFVVCCTV